jgi:hypothetical protein
MNVCPAFPIKRNGLWKQIGKFHAIATLGMSGLFALPQVAYADGLDGLGILLDVGYSYDDNLTLASNSADKRSDNALNVHIEVNKAVALSEHSRLAISGFIEAKAYATYGGLDRLSAGAEAEYLYRPSGEFGAPTFGLVTSAGRDEFRSDLRKSDRYAAGITLRQPVTSRINLYAALKDNIRRSDNDVFNTHDTSAQINVDYGLGNGNTLYLTTEYRVGDIVSTSLPVLAYRQISAAWIDDDVFNSGQTLRAYRLKGKTAVVTLGYNLLLVGKKSLDISWRYAKSASDLTPEYDSSTIKYVGNQFSIDYLMGF